MVDHRPSFAKQVVGELTESIRRPAILCGKVGRMGTVLGMGQGTARGHVDGCVGGRGCRCRRGLMVGARVAGCDHSCRHVGVCGRRVKHDPGRNGATRRCYYVCRKSMMEIERKLIALQHRHAWVDDGSKARAVVRTIVR